MPIQVGDAVLRFLGDTTDLERAWTQMEQNSKASASRAVNEVLRQYDKLGIDGSLKLRKAADDAAAAFEKLKASGIASLSDLVAAELKVIETQSALKRSIGEAIPPEVNSRVNQLREQYATLTGTLNQYREAQEKANAAQKQAALTAENAAIAEQRANTASRGTGGTGGTGGGTGGAGGFGSGALGAAGLGGGLVGLGTLATATAIYKVVQGLKDATEAALDFEGAFAEVTTLIDTKTPEGAQTVDLLRQQLLKLPPTLGDITELTKGLYQALSAGVPAANAVEFVGKSAIFAKAALTDVFHSVDLVTTIINAYGMSVTDAGHVTDALFQTISNAKVRGPELAEQLGRVIPIAASMKVNLNEVLAALDAMTEGGLKADLATTSLRQVLTSLEKPSSSAQKAAASLGISFQQIREEIETKGLSVALGHLAQKTQGSSELTTELFGNVRALTGVLSLSGPMAGKYAEYLGNITQASKDGTAAQEAMNKILDSQQGKLQTLGNQIKTEFITAWEGLKPATNSIASNFNQLLIQSGALQLAFVVLSGVVSAIAIVFDGLAAAYHSVIEVADTMLLGFANIVSVIPGAARVLKEHGLSVEDWKVRVQAASDAVDKHTDQIFKNAAAMKDLNGIQGDAKTKLDAFAAAQKIKADADSAAELATRKAGQAAQEAAAKLLEQKLAAEKAAEAMAKYAKAHNIPDIAELKKAVDEGARFYQQMVNSGAPMAVQTAAALSLANAWGKLHQALTDNRTVGEVLAEKGNELTSKLQTEVPKVKALELEITDPLVQAFNDVLEAEQRLGINGSATMSKHLFDAQEALGLMRTALENGQISLAEFNVAQREVDKASRELSLTLRNELDPSIQALTDAETKLGIEGKKSLQQHADDAQAAFKVIRAAYDSGKVGLTELDEAELKALEADVKLKNQQGIVVPDSEIQRLGQLKGAYEALVQAQQKSLDVATRWAAYWHGPAQTTGVAMKQIADLGKTAFLDFNQAMGQAVSQAILSQKGFGQAIQEAVAQALAALAAQATIQALWDTAKGFEMLANPLTAPLAPGYFESAGLMAGVAAAAGIAGAALNPGSGSGSGSSSSSSSTGTAIPLDSATTVAPAPVRTVNAQRFGAGALVSSPTLAIIGDSRHSPSQGAKEAVLPLEDRQAMSQIASAIIEASGDGMGGGTTFNIQGLISSDNLDKLIDNMNTRVGKGKRLLATEAHRVIRKS